MRKKKIESSRGVKLFLEVEMELGAKVKTATFKHYTDAIRRRQASNLQRKD